jgi:predicted Rossmann fold flavoprotein
VRVIEHANRCGKKILMSGGGRCNFTNLNCKPENFISANPSFCISALSRYTPWDFVALVERHGIAYHEKAHGQLFCDNSSKDILAMLQAECDAANVVITTHCNVTAVRREQRFAVESDKGIFSAAALVIATGGLSIPKMGASDFGYRLARQFGLRLRDTRAGLVPFTFTGSMQGLADRLAGVSTAAAVQTHSAAFTDDILFTHRGLSGPAALQASSYWEPGQELRVNLTPGDNLAEGLLQAKAARPQALLRTLLAEHLPRSLVAELQGLLWPDNEEKPIADWPDAHLHALANHIESWAIKPAATEGYRTAEVTMGGIDTDELSSRTLECRREPGLYCIGEVVDVTGQLGGFNFQWAWASAHAAAEAI